jgi:hypothetical protein
MALPPRSGCVAETPSDLVSDSVIETARRRLMIEIASRRSGRRVSWLLHAAVTKTQALEAQQPRTHGPLDDPEVTAELALVLEHTQSAL